MFGQSWHILAYFTKYIGNPIVKKNGPKNTISRFFRAPDGPMTLKITLKLGITTFYVADRQILRVLVLGNCGVMH